MRGNELLDKMELVEPSLVETADAPPRKKHPARWGALAACLVVAVAVGGLWLSQPAMPVPPAESSVPSTEPDVFPDADPTAPELPLLSLSENTGGMGYEGYQAYDISELVSANPWDESTKLSTLPVYQNALSFDQNFIATGADSAKMEALLLEVAGRLGLDEETLEITDDAPDEATRQAITKKMASVGEKVPEGYFDPTRLIGESEGIKLEVSQSLTATVTFEPAIALPEGYNFGYHTSYEETAAVASYLLEKYADLIGFAQPQTNISGGDYNTYGEQGYDIEFFEGSGSLEEQLVSCYFNRVRFICNEEGQLWMVRFFRTDLSQKLGDYPIISADEARTLLQSGSYITSVPYSMEEAGEICKVELVYRTGEHEQYYMPYYRFLVEVPENINEGMTTYGAYYVPAVESRYISNMPTWDGSFNS